RALSFLADSNVGASQHVSARLALPSTRVIFNGVPDTVDAQKGNPSGRTGPICFAYVGRLVTEKGVSVLIDSASILKERGCDFRVLIIGDGPESHALLKQAASLERTGNVEFAGFRVGTKLQEALREASVAIMPSIWEDVAPFSALEQMMRGRLIIGSRIG